MTANMYFALLFSFGFILAGVYAQPPTNVPDTVGNDLDECLDELLKEYFKQIGRKQATSKNYLYI